VLENSSDTVGAATVVDEEVLVSVGLVGESSPQLTHRTRAAINAGYAYKRIMFSEEVEIVLACGQKVASRGTRARRKQGLIHHPDISVTIR
jgi:hypothetical protein